MATKTAVKTKKAKTKKPARGPWFIYRRYPGKPWEQYVGPFIGGRASAEQALALFHRPTDAMEYVASNGPPANGCGMHGCRVCKPEGMAPNGPCRCKPDPVADASPETIKKELDAAILAAAKGRKFSPIDKALEAAAKGDFEPMDALPGQPSDRAIARAKSQPAPRKKLGRTQPAATRRDEAKDPNKVTPNAERDRWTPRRLSQTYGLHHPIDTEDEAMAIIEALGGVPALRASTGSLWARTNGFGTMLVDAGECDQVVNGHEVGALDLFAVSDKRYVVRILAGPEGDSSQIPDAQFILGLRMLAMTEPVTLDGMVGAIKALGLDLTKKMDPIEQLKRRVRSAEQSFGECPCEDCTKARVLAKENGTSVVDERLAMPDLKAGYQKLKDKLLPALKPEKLSKEDRKIQAALKRSTRLVAAGDEVAPTDKRKMH